ncbi:hypothetical protein FQA39_LY16137 [Lamprigera yunnana]|nr:hypothetical protein FQA39_LY16137 [Lamprigera yunnana]
MNVDRQEEEVTVQGVGSPVPARGELGAGSPGSIIGHCTVVEVGDQAFPPRLNTGTETSTPGTSRGNTPYEWDEAYPPPLRESTPLGRPKKLQISPTMSDRTRQEETPSNIAYLDYTWSDEAGTSVKRKRRYTNSPTDDAWKKEITVTARLANSYRKSIEKIKNEIKNLGKLIGENTNTKREIKEVSNKLRSLATVIGTAEMQDLLQSLGRQRNNSDYDTVITNLTEVIQEGKEREEKMNRELEQYRQDEDGVRDELMRELEQYRRERDEAREENESALRQLAEIRADAERLKYILSPDRTEEDKMKRINEGMMEGEKGFQNFAKLNEEKEWPSKVFKCVKFAGGNRERWKRERNVICVIGGIKCAVILLNTMNVDRQEEEVTVQGVGSPVPARGELGAGSPGSIIGHCTVVEVGDQAFPPRLNTGTETSTPGTSGGNTPYEWDEAYPPPLRESTPLGRPKRLQISPTMSDRTRQEETPSNIAYLDYTWSDEAGTSVKRKRRYTNSPTDDAWKKEITVTARLANSYRKSIEKIKNEIKNLGKLIGENTNTKREIKEVSNKLRSLATVIGTAEMQDLLQSLGRQRNNSDYDTVITNLTEVIQEGKEREEKMNRELEQYRLDEDGVRDELMRELEQYRRERDEAREESESALRQLAEIRADAERLKYILSTDRTEEVKMERINEGMMEGEKSFQNFAKLNEEKEWPSKVFKCVKLAGGNRERWKRERNNEIKNLGKLIGENTNTKREIKEVSNKLRSLATVIGTAEMQDLLQSLGRQRNNSDYDTVITNLTEVIQEGKEREEKMNRELEQYRLDEDGVRDELMRELEQYRRERDEAREESESALRQLAEIRADAERLKYILSTDRTEEVKMERINEGMMEGEKSFQNFAKLNEEKEWPSKVFKCVKFAGGNRERWKRERNIENLSNLQFKTKEQKCIYKLARNKISALRYSKSSEKLLQPRNINAKRPRTLDYVPMYCSSQDQTRTKTSRLSVVVLPPFLSTTRLIGHTPMGTTVHFSFVLKGVVSGLKGNSQ